MPISNEIFESYRIEERAREQLKALRFLAKQGYTILDTEGNIINKHNIDEETKPKWWYKKDKRNK